MATERNNDLLFVCNYAVKNIEFVFEKTADTYCITDGQPLSEVICTNDSPNSWKLRIKAGRKGSKEVAEWYKNQVGIDHSVTTDNYDNMPDKLNFAVKGTMKITSTVLGNEVIFECSDLVIAQGHNARSRNNWWIGHKQMNSIEIFEILKENKRGFTFFKGDKVGIPVLVGFTGKSVDVFNVFMLFPASDKPK